MKRLILALILAAAPVVAQTQPDPYRVETGERTQKLVTLKYADPSTVRRLLSNFGVEIQWDDRSKVIALSGLRSRVTTAEDAIKQLDVPAAAQKDIELTVYFVVGSDLSAGPGTTLGNPIPQDLQSTVAALKSTFAFKSYALLDVLSLQTRSGVGAETTGHLSGGRLSNFQVRSASIDGDGTMIRLDHLHAGVKVPVNGSMARIAAMGNGQTRNEYIDTGISTDVVDIKEGQRLVIGRSSLDGPDKALILILVAKVIG